MQSTSSLLFLVLLLAASTFTIVYPARGTAIQDLNIIPYPQQMNFTGKNIILNQTLSIVLDKNHTKADQFTAEELIKDLKKEWGIEAGITSTPERGALILTRSGAKEIKNDQGYRLTTEENGITIQAKGETGLFYGTQTFLQLIRKNGTLLEVPGLIIDDWPDIVERAVHYDTKHHQDKADYVRSFIKDMAKYKINMLVWEWEDKFAYPSHPEIGAPGAFTMKEMQEFTRYAQKYHIQIVPLVQGLGHVSFILKWPQYKGLREIADSNWEFCPLKDGSYDLLFDLWEDAMKATPGSEYIHIGSDETYELAACDQCRAKAGEIGKSGLYLLFVNKAAKHLQAKGRKIMAWERPMGWTRGSSPAKGIVPEKGLILTESYNYMAQDFHFAKESRALGYEVYAYDPNPGTTALFLPYFYRVREGGQKVSGSLENSYDLLTSSAISGAVDGMINTSWDDAGLHNQMWMLSFVTSAEYSWSGAQPTLQQFKEHFFKNYYGEKVMDMEELYFLLNEGAYYFMSTLERNVWHYGTIGKTHLPDLPRGDALEYDPFWNREYSDMVQKSRKEFGRIDRALQIIENNEKLGVRRPYDFELFRTIANLIKHTCQIYEDLSDLERTITRAHQNTFVSHEIAYQYLEEAQDIVESSLKRRTEVFDNLVSVWEKTRLPKGMSTKDKPYFHKQDRARHFANRRPDMTFLIYDEQLLDLEGYLKKLNAYMDYYKKTYLD
jgi:hypothetical protein